MTDTARGAPSLHAGLSCSEPTPAPRGGPLAALRRGAWRAAAGSVTSLLVALAVFGPTAGAARAGPSADAPTTPWPQCGPVRVPSGELVVEWGSGRVDVVGVAVPRELSPFSVLVEGDLPLRARLSARTRLLETARAVALDGRQRVGDLAGDDLELEQALTAVLGGLREERSDAVSDGTVLWRGVASLEPIHAWWAGRSRPPAPAVTPPAFGDNSHGRAPARFHFVVVRAGHLEPAPTVGLEPALWSSEAEVLLRAPGRAVYCRQQAAAHGPIARGGLYVVATARRGQTGCDLEIGAADAAVLRAAFPGRLAPLLVELPPEGDGPLPF